MRLVFATNNQHKMDEIRDILGSKFGEYVYSLKDIRISVNPDESGSTFEENSYIKAKCTYEAMKNTGDLRSGDYIIADDTGLCIDFYDGAPGIYSARFLSNLTQKEKNFKIIEDMDGVCLDKRSAKFVTDLAVIEIGDLEKQKGEPKTLHFSASVYGYIADKIYGDEGFGYDPIFAIGEPKDIIKGCVSTYASLGQNEKNKISHRAKALHLFVNYLEKNHNI